MIAGDQNVTKEAMLPWVKRTSGKTILVEADNILDINRFITAVFAINSR